jgi:hypothetical protein
MKKLLFALIATTFFLSSYKAEAYCEVYVTAKYQEAPGKWSEEYRIPLILLSGKEMNELLGQEMLPADGLYAFISSGDDFILITLDGNKCGTEVSCECSLKMTSATGTDLDGNKWELSKISDKQ